MLLARPRLLLSLLACLLLLDLTPASAGLIFDRGLPTINLNNAAGTNRCNISYQGGPYATADSAYQIYGDDFIIGTSGSYHINKVRAWIIWGGVNRPNPPTDLKLWISQEGASLELVSTKYTAKLVYYTDGQSYERASAPGDYRNIWQIDFNLDRYVEGGKKYRFFIDGPLVPNFGTSPGYLSNSLHASNAALSGSRQEGADNRILRLTITAGVPGKIEILDAASFGIKKSVDANVQVFEADASGPLMLLLND